MSGIRRLPWGKGVPALVLLGMVPVVGVAVTGSATTYLLAGALAMLMALPLARSLVRSAAWSLPVLVGMGVLLIDTGGRTIAPGPERYAATAVVVLTVLLVGTRPDRRSRALRLCAVALFAYGLLGTVYGRFVEGTVNGALPLILPLVIACLSPVRNWGDDPRWRTGLRALSAVGTVFATMSGLSRLGILPETQIDVLNHEKAFLVVMAVAAAVAARDRLLIVLSLAAAAFAFTAYPAATYVLAAVVASATVVLVRWAPGAGLRLPLALGTMLATAFGVLYIDRLIALTNAYFELVGKVDNGSTRGQLYRAALERFDSPIFSGLFTNDISVVGNLSGENRVVPVHNDYLSISLAGGLVAAALMLGLFLLANGLVLRAFPTMTDPWQRRTVITLLGALNAAAVSAFANPIFMNPGSSAVTYALLGALIAACRPAGGPLGGDDLDSSDPLLGRPVQSADVAAPMMSAPADSRR